MKLVRDNIPDIIRESGQTPIYRKLNQTEYREYLNEKLLEEIEEYMEENQIEELCDIVEVIYALIDTLNVTREEFERIRMKKATNNGKFEKRILLIEVKD